MYILECSMLTQNRTPILQKHIKKNFSDDELEVAESLSICVIKQELSESVKKKLRISILDAKNI